MLYVAASQISSRTLSFSIVSPFKCLESFNYLNSFEVFESLTIIVDLFIEFSSTRGLIDYNKTFDFFLLITKTRFFNAAVPGGLRLLT